MHTPLVTLHTPLWCPDPLCLYCVAGDWFADYVCLSSFAIATSLSSLYLTLSFSVVTNYISDSDICDVCVCVCVFVASLPGCHGYCRMASTAVSSLCISKVIKCVVGASPAEFPRLYKYSTRSYHDTLCTDRVSCMHVTDCLIEFVASFCDI